MRCSYAQWGLTRGVTQCSIPRQTTQPRVNGRVHLLQALGYRDFRLFWTGLTISSVGSWMQIFALGILLRRFESRSDPLGTPRKWRHARS